MGETKTWSGRDTRLALLTAVGVLLMAPVLIFALILYLGLPGARDDARRGAQPGDETSARAPADLRGAPGEPLVSTAKPGGAARVPQGTGDAKPEPETFITLRGRLLDELGAPVSGVDVQWVAGAEGGVPDRTDAAGKFKLRNVPVLEGLTLFARSHRFEDLFHAIRPERDDDAELILVIMARDDHIVGRVVDPYGTPIEATLALSSRYTQTNAFSGEFALDLQWLAPHDSPLVVSAQGFGPASFPHIGRDFLRFGRRHPPMEIVLHPAKRVRGNVVWSDGTPAAGVQVSLKNPTPLWNRYAEQDASVSGEMIRETDESGAFEIDGLGDHRYEVIAVDHETLYYAVEEVQPWSDPHRADLVLRLPAPSGRRTVHGTVRYPDGEPASDVSVYAFVAMAGRPSVDKKIRRSADVAEDGTFVFEDLPLVDLELSAGVFTSPGHTPLPARATEVEMVLQRLCGFSLFWPLDVPPPDVARAFDASDNELDVYKTSWGVYQVEPRLYFHEPSDGPRGEQRTSFYVPENATTVVLMRAGVEVRRIPVEPRPGREQPIRP